MEITVNMCSEKSGELKRFLNSYYCCEESVDADVDEWIYVYRKSADAVDIISALSDNNEKFDISMYIQVNGGDAYPITDDNHNDVIKGIFQLSHLEVMQKISKFALA